MLDKFLENEILIHRYCYYIKSESLVSDFIYDALEKEAREIYPETSPVHKVGSSLISDYPSYIIEEAERRLNGC